MWLTDTTVFAVTIANRNLFIFTPMKHQRTIYLLLCIFFVYSFIQAQELKPRVAEFGAEPYESPLNTVEPPKIIEWQEESLDTAFVVTLQEVSQYYQSTRLIIAFTNNSRLLVDNFWIQVRLLDRNGSFLYREQPILFTGIQPGRTVRGEVLCESIGIAEVGYVVIRPELLETERHERHFESRFVKLESTVDAAVKLVFSSMFE